MSVNSDSSNFKLLAIFAGILIFVWGSAYTMVGIGVDYISPIWLVAYRLIIGACLVTAYAFIKGHRFPKLNDRRWPWYLCLGITGSVLPFFLLSTGQKTVDSGLTSILVGIMPILTIVLAHFFTDEKLNARKLLGFVIGFIGTVILFIPDSFSLELVQDWKAQLLIIGAAICYAVTTVGAKRAPETPSSIAAAMMLIMAASIGLIAALISGVPEGVPPLPGLLSIIGLGVGATGLATILYLYVIQLSGPSLMARINYFVPVVSVILGVWFLHEPLSWRIILSFIIILIGVVISRSGVKAAKPI